MTFIDGARVTKRRNGAGWCALSKQIGLQLPRERGSAFLLFVHIVCIVCLCDKYILLRCRWILCAIRLIRLPLCRAIAVKPCGIGSWTGPMRTREIPAMQNEYMRQIPMNLAPVHAIEDHHACHPLFHTFSPVVPGTTAWGVGELLWSLCGRHLWLGVKSPRLYTLTIHKHLTNNNNNNVVR